MKEQKNSIGVSLSNKPHDCAKPAPSLTFPRHHFDFLNFTFGFQPSFLLPCFNWVMVAGLHLLFVTDCSVSYKYLNSLGWFGAV
jgi:hypothetical protein